MGAASGLGVSVSPLPWQGNELSAPRVPAKGLRSLSFAFWGWGLLRTVLSSPYLLRGKIRGCSMRTLGFPLPRGSTQGAPPARTHAPALAGPAPPSSAVAPDSGLQGSGAGGAEAAERARGCGRRGSRPGPRAGDSGRAVAGATRWGRAGPAAGGSAGGRGGAGPRECEDARQSQPLGRVGEGAGT